MDWQPIETAPRDGTMIYAINATTRSLFIGYGYLARYQDGRFGFAMKSGATMPVDPQPTHWMPLPAPPSA